MRTAVASWRCGFRGLCALSVVLFATTLGARAIVSPGFTSPSAGVTLGRLSGVVTWDAGSLDGTVLYLYRDAALKDLKGTYPLLSDDGRFDLRVEPGRYYVVGVIDRNRSGAFDGGDLLGVHGIRHWSDMGQRKRAVTVRAGDTASSVDVPITALRRAGEGAGGVEGLGEPDTTGGPPPPISAAPASISGTVRLSAGARVSADAPVYVLAYVVQLSRHRWLGQTRTAPNGTFELRLPPGSYFVAAIADENRSNVLDTGDLIGFHGVTGADGGVLNSTPRSVTLAFDRTLEGLDIPIVARMTGAGGLTGVDALPEREPEPTRSVELAGEVRWGAAALPPAVVELYVDASLARPVARTLASASGHFRFDVPVGNYYVVANLDKDGDGRVSAGDGVGSFGTSDVAALPPQAYRAEAGAPSAIVDVSATYGSGGQLVPLAQPTATTEGAGPRPAPSGVSGRILWDGRSPRHAWILVSESLGFQDPATYRAALDQQGGYILPLDPGTYFVMAAVDASGDGGVGAGDGVGVYGTRNPLFGGPAAVRVWPGRTTQYVNVTVGALMTDDQGGHTPLDDGNRSVIRRTHGEPDDRYRRRENGVLVEEWWYWTRGVSFTFAADGPGWNLEDTYEFTPNVDALEEMRPQNLGMARGFAGYSGVDATVYYGADRVVWWLHPDGLQEPVSYGTLPVATAHGLLYVDEDLDLVLMDFSSGQTSLMAPAREGVEHVAMSPGGQMLALVQASGVRILSLGGPREIAVPLAMDPVTSIAWHRSQDLLFVSGVNAARGSADGDIFVYDPAENRLEPVLSDPGDDTDIACSPSRSRELAFTRQGDSGSQVWLLELSDTGENEARQLTTFGGSQPAWLPDGEALVYVVDGQLWTLEVDVGAESARPLVVNGEVILGETPTVAGP